MEKNVRIPNEVTDILLRLERASFEAYAVGGCVRDLLLGRAPNDWDVTTNAKPEDIQKIFSDTFYANQFLTVTVKTGTVGEFEGRYCKDGCPCGRRLGVKLCHYGDINDCRTPEEGYFNPAGEDVITRRARIPDATDARGCPIEAYRQVKHTL